MLTASDQVQDIAEDHVRAVSLINGDIVRVGLIFGSRLIQLEHCGHVFLNPVNQVPMSTFDSFALAFLSQVQNNEDNLVSQLLSHIVTTDTGGYSMSHSKVSPKALLLPGNVISHGLVKGLCYFVESLEAIRHASPHFL